MHKKYNDTSHRPRPMIPLPGCHSKIHLALSTFANWHGKMHGERVSCVEVVHGKETYTCATWEACVGEFVCAFRDMGVASPGIHLDSWGTAAPN